MVSNCFGFNEMSQGFDIFAIQISNKHIYAFVFWYKTIDSHNIQKFHTTDHAPMRKPNFCSKLVVCECELWFCGVHGWVATSDSFGMEW